MADPIFHIADEQHWRQASVTGSYTWSTRGRTLADEGFIHCSEAHQWEATLARFYVGYPSTLVLLTIDPARLAAPLVREVGNPVTGEKFPHLYGPLNVDAVVATRDLSAPEPELREGT